MTEEKFAKFRNKWYKEPAPVWSTEEMYLESKASSIALLTSLLSQNNYDFYTALETIYKSEDVYDEISDWKGEGCLYFVEDYYDDLCEELEIQPVEYDFEKIRNPKILEQIKFVLELEQKRLAEKKQGYEFFVENENAIQKAIEEKNLA